MLRMNESDIYGLVIPEVAPYRIQHVDTVCYEEAIIHFVFPPSCYICAFAETVTCSIRPMSINNIAPPTGASSPDMVKINS
jgi:hypothetical protein